MRQIFFIVLMAVAVCGQLSTHRTIDGGNFSCNRDSELIIKTEAIGTIQSPCFDNVTKEYPIELTSGFKLVNITYGHAHLYGYRFTIRQFQLDEDDFLYFGDGLEKDSSITRAIRDVSLSSITTTTINKHDENAKTNETLSIGESFLLENYTSVFVDFYTIKTTAKGLGYLIDYAADINLCGPTDDDSYCKNDGICSRTGFNAASCNCTGTGYNGTTCTTDINECESADSCVTNATCSNTNGSYNCTCNDGFSGDGFINCTDINECTEGTAGCHANATCTNNIGSFVCACKTGFTGDGKNCEDIKECNNTGTCDGNATCTELIGSYRCNCSDGFTGDGNPGNCTDKDECVSNKDDCDVNANCTNIPGSFECTCIKGFTGTGKSCSDVKECDVDGTCDDNATCTELIGSFNCTCKPGFIGDGSPGNCADINECNSSAPTPHDCHANATCTNNPGSFDCTCNEGFTGTGKECLDIDECDLNTDDCDDNANCTNTEGSFTCECNEGFTGNGKNCTDIIECGASDDCDDNAECKDTPGSFTCTCKTGYTGNGTSCPNVNECETGVDDCDLNANCTDTDGSFDCTCKSGFTGNGKACTDIKECDDASTCDGNATCTELPGSFNCACNSGFIGDGDPGNCTDINECDPVSPMNNCHGNATCTNNPGSYDCTCNEGFTGNGVECSDNDECTLKTDDCDGNATCTNNEGSFTCACNDGFSGDGKTCTDNNECDLNTDDCDTNANCINNPGSFTCMCKEGYTGTGKTCSDINECTKNTHNCDPNADCTNTNGSFNCACKSGFSGNGTFCEDIDECIAGHNCTDGESTCRNTIGSFVCVCDEPTFRGSVGKCEYYCQDNTTCLMDRTGFIESPSYWDGSKLYTRFKETFFNFQLSSTGKGIRFIFIGFNTEIRDDFFSVYRGSVVDIDKEIVAISGRRGSYFNEEASITESVKEFSNGDVTATFDQSGDRVVLTFSSSDLHVAFTSDRLNASTGYKMSFEYDKDDCPSPTTCVNASAGCRDLTFDYECICDPGYEGKDCDKDIDECGLTGDDYPCAANPSATCMNTHGSYECSCNTDYFDSNGDGSVCKPHLILSNYVVTATTTSLSINFEITEAWRSAEYIVSFLITVDGGGRTITANVTLQELSNGNNWNVNGLNPYTEYSITVAVDTTGPLYDTAEFENRLGTQQYFTEQITPPPVPNVDATGGLRDRVTIMWAKPEEIGFGVVTHYQICYTPATDSFTTSVVQLREVTTEPQCIYVDDTYTSYTWIGVPSYLSLQFTVKAFTVAGAGEENGSLAVYTGQICDQWESFALRKACPHREGLLLMDGFPQNETNSDNKILEQQWSFDLTPYTGFRPYFYFFQILSGESNLDWGYGEDDITDHDTGKDQSTGTFTGTIPAGPNPEEGVPKNVTNATENTLWFSFISDRTRKQAGFQVEIEVDGDNCYSSPCLNGGDCSDALYGYICECTPEWKGESCEDPRVEPVVTCTPGKRDAEITFSIPADRGNDETIIGGYTVSGTGSVTSMTKMIGDSSASFTGLTPYTEYTFTVTVNVPLQYEREEVLRVPETVTCQTLEDVPTAPRNVVVDGGDQDISVTWEAPAEPNGVVRYIVTAISTDHATYGETEEEKTSTELSDLSYTITGLRVYRTYSVNVQAKTSAGSSTAAAETARTDPGPAPAITGSVTVISNQSARIDYTVDNVPFIGPVTVTASAEALTITHSPTSQSSMESPFILSGLEEGVNYTITVTASTGTPPDTSFQQDISTLEIAPGSPATFTYDAETSTLSWTPPDEIDRNGVITGYVLSSDEIVPGFTSPQSFPASELSFVLPEDLLPFTKYKFNLQARNKAGDGMKKELEITTKEAVPDAVSNITEGAVTANSISMSWEEQRPPVGNVVYYITYTDGTTMKSVTAANPPVVLSGLKAYTDYTITVVAGTNAGNATGTMTTIRTAEDAPGPVNNLAASHVVPYSILVTWDAPESPNGEITQYTVTWSPGASPSVDVVDGVSYTITNAIRSLTEYTIIVTASTSVGEGPTQQINVTTPSLVNTAPTDVTVTNVSPTSAVIDANRPSNAEDYPVVRYVVDISQDNTDCTEKGDDSCLSNDQGQQPVELPYTITGLLADRKYIVKLAAEGAAGLGAFSDPVEFATPPGVPGTPTIVSIERVPGGFRVTLDASVPFTGPANYTVTVNGAGGPFTKTVESSEMTGIVVEVTGLAGDTNYTVSTQASNPEGSSGESTPVASRSSPAAPTISIDRTSNTTLTVTITEVPDAVNYTITYSEVGCDSCVAPDPIVISGPTHVITGLKVYTEYSVSVFVTSSIGDGISAEQTVLTRVGSPSLIDEAASATFPDSSFREPYTARVENLCARRAEIFNETRGPITRIAYFVIQEGSTDTAITEDTFEVFYNNVRNQNPRQPYLSITVTCGSRRKRQASNDNVDIGTEDNCPNTNAECNGRLAPETTYTFRACGQNEDDLFVCTMPTESYTTAPAPQGLSAGEIAAIVICTILLIILLILLVVYCVRRTRNRRGKHTVSRRGETNPSYEAKQKYKVEPTEAKAEYSESPEA